MPGDGREALSALLSIEERLREAASVGELRYLAANECRPLIGARQVFVMVRAANGRFAVRTASSLSAIDRNAPLIRGIERVVRNMVRENGRDSGQEFELTAFDNRPDSALGTYPFGYARWEPLKLADGGVFAAILATRDMPWREGDVLVARRLARTIAHSWRCLAGKRALKPRPQTNKWLFRLAVVSPLMVGFVPVPMTALAPVEVVAGAPAVVAAPIDGVISEIPAAPNTFVKKGAILFRFEDTTLRNKLALAEEDMRLAEARYRRAVQSSLVDPKARRDLATTKAEFELKRTERDYAREVLATSVVRAPRDGLVLYPDADKLKGRPVRTGEQVMRVADPDDLALKVELPVKDAILLKSGARMRVFLDADPLQSLPAKLVRISYHARPNATNQLVYELRGKFSASHEAASSTKSRIGARGTAEVFGSDVSLAFFLFRRPIAYLRQRFGL